MPKTFDLTGTHLRLLSNLCIDEGDGDPFQGGPKISEKRPFGNGDALRDVARILSVDLPSLDEMERLGPEEKQEVEKKEEALRTIYAEIGMALEVVLEAQTFEPGMYVKEGYASNWTRMEESALLGEERGAFLTALQVRTDALMKIRKASSAEEASKIAGEAMCIGPNKKEILRACLREDLRKEKAREEKEAHALRESGGA